MSVVGHSRPGRANSKSGHVRYAPIATKFYRDGSTVLRVMEADVPRCTQVSRGMSLMGHSRPSHFVPVLNNVRDASDSDHSRYEFELTLWGHFET